MTMLDSALADFTGILLRPHDDGYDDARRLWNAAHDKRPAFIARCRSTADVAAAVRFGTAHGLPLAVRGGGHSLAGLSACDGGLMIDLSLMRRVAVDPATRRAVAQPGCTLADLDSATAAHGLATPGGEISHTGIAGLTLGGGVGWLSRMHGLSCDNLVAAEVVTAAGEVVRTEDDPQLLWGLRGGGGNFGVVTRFTYALHPVAPLLAGMVAYPVDRAPEVVEQFRDLARQAPDPLSLSCVCVTAPPLPFVPEELHFRPIVAIAMAWVGDPANGRSWAARLRSAGPAVDAIDVMPYPVLQSLFDGGAPHGLHSYTKSEWLADLDVGAVAAAARTMTSPMSQILIRQLGGGIRRVPEGGAAFSYRDAEFIATVPAMWAGPDEDPAPHVAWSRGLWERLRIQSSGGGYVNQLDADEGADRVRAAYTPQAWARLVGLKRRYDPDNVFRRNANIPPW